VELILCQLLTSFANQAASRLTEVQEEESERRRKKSFQGNSWKKMPGKKMQFQTGGFRVISFRR
jgi:hypothetical protein